MSGKIYSALIILAVSWAAVLSADPCSSPRTVEELAPGLTHLVLCRGEGAVGDGYRLVFGPFPRQSVADQTLKGLEEMGIAALPISDGKNYRVVTRTSPERRPAEDLERQLLTTDFKPPPELEKVQQDLTHPGGPWRIHVLEVDPSRIDVRVAHAFDAAIGIEETTALARRRGALAAINGGYYAMKGLLAGDAQGVLKIDGVLLSEPDRGRAGVGFYRDGKGTQSVFGRLSFLGELRLGNGRRFTLDGLNRQRGEDEVILYSPEFHRTTLTDRDGAEIVVESGRILSIFEQEGSTKIPAGGFVVSMGRGRMKEILPALRVGDEISVITELLPLLPDPRKEWEKVDLVLGGGPLLLFAGRKVEEPEKESISQVFFHARHPRTAVGKRSDGTLLLVTVDGRQPGESVGMTLPELTDFLLELEAVFAINLDGGGSTTMSVRGETVNVPSSAGGDRANGDALLLFARSGHQ
jgi:hypothetical protein